MIHESFVVSVVCTNQITYHELVKADFLNAIIIRSHANRIHEGIWRGKLRNRKQGNYLNRLLRWHRVHAPAAV
jgi:hypothetical protein